MLQRASPARISYNELMAVLRIAKMGNPVLLRKAEPVADPTAPEIKRLAADMQETLEDIGASGLAAPQVFVSKRVVVYRIIASGIPEGSGLVPRPWTVMVNPIITPKREQKPRSGSGAAVNATGGANVEARFGIEADRISARGFHLLERITARTRRLPPRHGRGPLWRAAGRLQG